jgi:methyl-accepting chemotaxis protein
MTTPSPDISLLARRLFMQHQKYSLLSIPPLVYMLSLTTALSGEQAWAVSKAVLPIVVPLLGGLVPYGAIYAAVRRAFHASSSDAPGARMGRLLELPRVIELIVFIMALLGIGCFVLYSVLRFDKTLWFIPWSFLNVGLLTLMTLMLERLAFEQTLRPYALAIFREQPVMPANKGGLLWPRQSWLLPYAFTIFISCTLVTTVSILGRGAYGAYERLLELAGAGEREQFAQAVVEVMSLLARDMSLPVLLVGGYLLTLSALTAWRLVVSQKQGIQSVQDALQGLAEGRPRMPDWVSTDEIGDLSVATTRIFGHLRSFSLELKGSATSLQQSAEQLGLSTGRQAEMLSVQASALQETQVTVQEIKSTSLVASQKAVSIMEQVQRANDISRAGEAAIARGLTSLTEIGSQVKEMAGSIRSLDERAQQIARITSMVKDLADQSNMLALNAAIEAVRSGESGKGFGVVAREIRALADQSIDATQNINSILRDITTAIAASTSMMDKGVQRVESSLGQVREFSEQVQQLSAIVSDNANAVKQITAAVSQQDIGIAQINQAVLQLSGIMEQTMSQMRASEQSIATVSEVAKKVSGFVEQYGWNHMEAALPASQ